MLFRSCVIALAMYFVYKAKKPNRTPRREGWFDRFFKDSGSSYYDEIPSFESRRPYVVYGGGLREVLRRKQQPDGRLLCTLRPESKGGARPQIAVKKDQIIWSSKKEG